MTMINMWALHPFWKDKKVPIVCIDCGRGETVVISPDNKLVIVALVDLIIYNWKWKE